MTLLAVALLLAAGPAQAAVEHVRDTPHGGFRSRGETFNVVVDPGEGRYLLAAIAVSEGVAVTSAMFAGRPMGLVAAATSPTPGGCRTEWWGFASPPVGESPFSVTFSGRSGVFDTTLVAYQGVAGLDSFGAVSGSGPDGPTRLTLTSAPGEVVLDLVCGWSPDSVVDIAGDGQISPVHWSSGLMSSAISQHAGAPSVTMTWTDSGPGTMEWAGVAVALRATGRKVSVGLNVESTGCAAAGRPQGGIGGWPLALLWGYARRRRRGNMGRSVS